MVEWRLHRGAKRWFTFLNAFLSLTLFNTTLFITAINATHFRGGTVWWAPSADFSDTSPEIHIEYQIGWRTTFRNDIICSDELISNQTVNPGVGHWETNDGNIVAAEFVCTGFDPDQDWMTGYYSFFYNVTTSNLTIWNQGRCWVSELYYPGCGWSLSFSVTAGTRSDTKKPNSSPLANIAPIINMHVGCPETVKLSTTDPDGDRVTCRFATTELECGDVCKRFPYFELTENCDLSYNGGGTEALIVVAVIIEDSPNQDITIDFQGDINTVPANQPISYIPLQFLVSLTISSNPCNARPEFVGETPPQGQSVSTVTGGTFQLTVFAKASISSENITDIIFLLPVGAIKSELQVLPEDTYRVDVTWVPSFDQLDSNLICFTAKDSAGLSSEQRCITVVVGGVSSPCSVKNGGCSDRCVTISEVSYACDCPRDCWYLDSDGRTCRPNVVIECLSETMEVSLEKCAVDNPLVTLADFATTPDAIPQECQPNTDSDFYNFSLSFDQCNMFPQETFWDIKYTNIIRLYADAGVDDETLDSDSVISRGAWFHVPVTCSFSKLGNLTFSFVPVDREVQLLDVPGLGSFSFILEFYNNESFEHAIGPYDFPLSFTVNSDIYFGIRAVGGASNTQVFTVQCLALPSTDQSTEGGYEMITEGCLRDSTMRQYNTSSPMENHFSIKAFKFRDSFGSQDEPTVVNIQCFAMVCQNEDDVVSRCAQGCLDGSDNTRRKRDLRSNKRIRRQSLVIFGDDDGDDDEAPRPRSNVTESPLQQVTTSGNIQILVDVSNIETNPPIVNPVSPTDENLSTAIFIGIGIGGLLMVIVIGAGVFIFYHKIMRSKNLIIPTEDHHHNSAYVRDIFVPNISPKEMSKGTDIPRYFHLDPTPSDYVWARRVISTSHNSLVRLSSCAEDWKKH